MLPSCPLWIAPLVFRPLFYLSALLILSSAKTCIPLEMWRVGIWHQQIHTLALPSPDNSIHQHFCLLQNHNSHKACFWKQVSKFLFFSESVNPSHSHNTSFCMTEMPKFIIHRLLLSKISSFTFSTKAVLLYLCHLATTLWDRWGTQHVLFP